MAKLNNINYFLEGKKIVVSMVLELPINIELEITEFIKQGNIKYTNETNIEPIDNVIYPEELNIDITDLCKKLAEKIVQDSQNFLN